jgi:hypothetical protein
LIASTAMRTLPSVPFLNPTGHDRPEASWRCVCDSVVRAPIAPHAMRSAMYCGEMRSRNSVPQGHADLVHLEEELARKAQPLVHVEGLVQVRVVDEALPADGGARLLEVNAHDDREVVAQPVALALHARRVLDRRLVVVDRARPHHDEQPVVGAAQDVVHGLAPLERCLAGAVRGGELAHHLHGSEKLVSLLDADVVGAGSGSWKTKPPVLRLAVSLGFVAVSAQILPTARGVGWKNQKK